MSFGYQVLGFGAGGLPPFAATGGTVATSGGYKYHTFTSSGTFSIVSPSLAPTIEYLAVAGGGGGAKSAYGNYPTSAGAAGGLLQGNATVSDSSYTITVGAGGAGVAASATNNGNDGTLDGSNTTIGSLITACVGGGGGSGGTGRDGGSGSGAGNGAGGVRGVVELRDKAMTVVLVLLALAVSQLSVRAAQVVQEPLA